MITIKDPGTVLSPSQVQTLTEKAAAYPFDVHVIIGDGKEGRFAFESAVDQAVVPGSRMVSIGVDPVFRFVHEHASGSLGLPSGPTIASAGNAFFRKGDIVEGIDAIAAKANELRVQTRTVMSQTGVPIVIHEHKTAAGVWWTLGALGLLVAAVVAWALWRSKKRDEEAAAARAELESEASELRARNLEEQDWHDQMARARRRGQASDPVPASTPLPVVEPRGYPAGRVAPSQPPTVVVQASAPPAPIIVNPTVIGGRSSGLLDTMLEVEMIRDLDRTDGRYERDRYAPPIIEREIVEERGSSSSSLFSSADDDSSSSSSFVSGSDGSSSSSDSSSSDDSSSGGSSDW